MTMLALSPQNAAAIELIELSQEKSPQKRLELLRRITDEFIEESDNFSNTSRYLLNEIVTRVMAQLRGRERAAAATTLSKMPHLPEDVVRNLASDQDIAIARPILQDYGDLSEQILVDVASVGSQAHLHAMASRPQLGTPVTDIVVQRGDSQVVRTLTANQGARFSRDGMRTLIDKAEKDARLQRLIVDRCDLTFEAVGQLLPLISQELAGRLHGTDMTFDITVLQDQVVSWMSYRKRSIDKVNQVIEDVRRGSLKVENAMMEFVVSRQLLNVATLIAAVCDLERDYAFNLLTQGRTENVLLLLKSLNLPWPTTEAFLKLRLEKLGEGVCGKMVEEGAYSSIDLQAAQRVIRFLKVRRLVKPEPA